MEAQKKAAMGLKPCIAELVRTQYCPPSVVLVVQKIMEVPVHTPRGPKQAFRLMLTDGEKMIQATLMADMHWFVVVREIAVGAFVVLDKYRLAKAMRKNKNGSVGYLQITDLHAIGYVDGYGPSEPAQSLKTPQLCKVNTAEGERERIEGGRPASKKIKLDEGAASPQPGGSSVAGWVGDNTIENRLSTKRARFDIQDASPHHCTNNAVGGVENDSGETRLATEEAKPDTRPTKNSDPTQSMGRSELPRVFPRNVHHRKIIEHWDRCHRVPFPQLLSPYSNGHATANKDRAEPHPVDELTDEQVDMLFPQACMSLSQYAISTIEAGKSLKRISRPLDIVTLKGLAGLAKKQNRICGKQAPTTSRLRTLLTGPLDILAVIESSPTPIIKRPHLPPKRDITISDPSTIKRITLSVFVDASSFTPAIGTICLLRNVRNHRFNGQSLNAYPEDCEGWDWFIPNPEWAVPAEKMEWLRGWWAERLERKRRWDGCEVDESDNEFGYPAEKPPPRERVWGGSDDDEDDD